MTANFGKGYRLGLLFSSILLIIDLLGFTTIVTGVAEPIIFLGLWCGVSAARRDREWGSILVKAIGAALTGGLLLAVFAYLTAAALAAHFDLRGELAAMSPDAIRAMTFGQPPFEAAVFNFGMFAGIVLGGAIVFHWMDMAGWGAVASQWWSSRRETLTGSSAWMWTSQTTIGQITGYATVTAIVLVLPLIVPSILNYYTVSSVLIYVLMALGLNIVVGLAGLLDLGYVVFFAIGAYTAALLTAPYPHHFLWSFWVVIPVGIALAAGVGVILGVPVLRLRGDYLAIVTLGFGETIRVLMKSDALTAFSNGPKGVSAIGQPMIFGQLFNTPFEFVLMSGVGAAVVIFLTTRLTHSRVGRAWIAIREDETVARAMGINTLFYKLLAFGIGASFAGIGGLLYASRNQFTGPEDHTLLVSINILSIVIVGGMGSIPGVILGAWVLKGIPEILRDLENFRILIFAALLVVMMIWRPQGLIPSARRRLEMHVDEIPIDEQEASTVKGTAK